MDFHSLTRRELQALCKKNKIPANMTNVAMADALKALQIVEGLEDFTNPESEKDPQSPEKTAIGFTEAPRTAYRTSTRRKPVKGEPESMQPATQSHRGTRRGFGEPEEEKREILETPVVPSTRKRAAAASTRRKAEASVKQENSVQRVYSTRRSVRLLEKMAAESSLKERRNAEAVKIDELSEEIAKDLQKLSVESSERSDDLDEVSEKGAMRGTDSKTFPEESSERIDDSEILSDTKPNVLPKKEGDFKDEVQNSNKGDDNGVNVVEEKPEDGSDASHDSVDFSVSDVKFDDDYDKNKVCKRLEESVILPGGDLEKAIDINHETVEKQNDVNDETNEKIEHNEVPITMHLSGAEDLDGVLMSESTQDSNANQAMGSEDSTVVLVSGDVSSDIIDIVAPETSLPQEISKSARVLESVLKSSLSSRSVTDQERNPKVECQNIVSEDSDINVGEGHHGYRDLASQFEVEGGSDGSISDQEDSKDFGEDQVSRSKQVECGKEDGIPEIVDSKNYKEGSCEIVSESITAADIFAEVAVDNYTDDVEEDQKDSKLVSEEQMYSEQLESGQENESPDSVDHENQKEDFDELVKEPANVADVFPGEVSVNESDSENSVTSESETEVAPDFANQESTEFNNTLASCLVEHTMPEAESDKFEEWVDVREIVAEENATTTNECNPSLDKSPYPQKQISDCHLVSDSKVMGENLLQSHSPSSLCRLTKMTVENPVLETGNHILKTEIMAEIPFSTLAADSLPDQTPSRLHQVRIVSGSDSHPTHLTPRKSASKTPASIRRMIHVLDEDEKTDNSGRKSSSKTPTTVRRMTQVWEDNKENVGKNERKSLIKTTATIQRMTHDVIDDNKENIGKSGRNMEHKKENKRNMKDMAEDSMLKALNDTSLRQLRKMFKEKLQIRENINNTEDVNVSKMAKTRPALQALPENHLAECEPKEEN